MSQVPNTVQQGPVFSISTFLAHRRMVLCLFLSTLVIITFLVASLQVDDPSILKAVALAGALGGFVSALRRFYSLDNAAVSSAAIRVFGRSTVYVMVYSLIPPLIGAVGATVVYVMLAGQMLSGGPLPNFANVPDDCCKHYTHFQTFIYDWKPQLPVDYAKVLIWGFVAGFSERFVPSLLEKLTAQVGK